MLSCNRKNEKNYNKNDRTRIRSLIFLPNGYMNKDIAKLLYITERTVKAHLSSIYRKLNVKNLTAAVVKAVSKGLIDKLFFLAGEISGREINF